MPEMPELIFWGYIGFLLFLYVIIKAIVRWQDRKMDKEDKEGGSYAGPKKN